MGSVEEEKKLNFDKPFLSIRRHLPAERDDERRVARVSSAMPRLPSYLSELKSGPVSNPGTVPFQWEQIPGHPKEHTENWDTQTKSLGRFTDDSSVRNCEEECCESFTDALSRSDSFFFKCSVSDFSEFDNLDVKVKELGSFLSNPKSREFMMDRFLPAAKAMASEAPQYGHKKQHAIQEQPQQLRNILMQNQSSMRYSFYHDYEEVSDDESDQPGNSPASCGLLHRICLKNRLCLLNPMPAMKIRSRLLASSFSKVQPRSSSSGSYSETENESKSDITEPSQVDKIQIVELKETKSRLGNEHRHTESTYFDASVSFLEDEVLSINPESKSPVINGNGCKTFRDFLAEHESQNEIDSEGLVEEKTLFVETTYKMESPDKLLSPRTHVRKSLDQMHSRRSSYENFNKLDSVNVEDRLLPVTHTFVSLIENSNEKTEMRESVTPGDAKKADLYSPAAEKKQVTEKGVPKVSLNTSTIIEPCASNYEVPLSLPSLKSPSDSWLSRTLPTASRKTIGRLSSLAEQPKVQGKFIRHPRRMSYGN